MHLQVNSDVKVYDAAPMDMWAVTVTVLWVVEFCVVLVIPFIAPWPLSGILSAALVVELIGLILMWQLKPIRYEILRDSIAIIRGKPFRTNVIPLANVRKVERAKLLPPLYRGLFVSMGLPDDMFNIHGEPRFLSWFPILGGIIPFSYCGLACNFSEGTFWLMLTHGNYAVNIEGCRNCIISPANPDEFIEEVKKRMPDLHGWTG